MQSYIQTHANRLIPPARHKSLVKVKRGTTKDIMEVVLSCYNEANGQVKKFAPLLKSSNKYTTCRNVWEFVKDNIAYKIDPPGEQWIKEPARVWLDKECDCKSYSVFIASLLHHLGINAKFRFVSFDSYNPEPTHVYVVVPGTEEIILDCVMPHFDSEAPYK
jgi:Transglutaminase-like superfamily